jgi:hypothetical protein
LNKDSERNCHLRTFSLWSEEDHSFVKEVIAEIRQVQVVGVCEKRDFMQSDRKEKSIFVQEQWQRILSGKTETNLRIIIIPPELPKSPCTDFADASNRLDQETISARKRIHISGLADFIRSCKDPNFHLCLSFLG